MASETDVHDVAWPEGEVAEETSAAPDNALERLRARRNSIGAEMEKSFAIPGYGGMLLARYRRLSYEETRKALLGKLQPGQRAKGEQELEGQVAFLARACVGVYMTMEDRDPVQLSPNYGPELAEVLEINLERRSAADVLRAVFNNDLAIPIHQLTVMRWMQGTDEDVDEEFSGE